MKIAIIVFFVAMSAIFSGTETAFSSANLIRLKSLAAGGKKSAKTAVGIIERYDKALTAVLIGNNIVNIGASSIATVLFTATFGSNGAAISTIVMTVAVLIFGEILPKNFAKENAEAVCLAMAYPLKALMTVFTPLIVFFIFLKNIMTRLSSRKKKAPTVTEEELMYMIDEIEDEGVLEEQESNLVRSALEFDETQVEEILIPRVNVIAIDKNEDIEKIKDCFFENSYSRFPVYDESIDNIIGILHQNDFCKAYLNGERDIASLLKKPLFVSEYQKISDTLKAMQKEKVHMAVVLDEYGGTSGIVTLEDIIEELVGEIYDESDDEDNSFIKVAENKYDVSADLSISDFAERTGIDEDEFETDCNSLGGLFMDQLHRVACKNDKVEYKMLRLTATQIEDQWIERIEVEIKDMDNEELGQQE
ncbi:MAG: hemolysin family protein [Ruminococcus sp.]|nr:hemolysin family protein [Ruminococcus sp.]